MRYHARWVLPITQPPVENGTVVERDGLITYVGPRSSAPPGDDYDLGDAILLPGLVNTHTHLELTAMRGFLEDCRFTAWIDKLRQSRNEVLNEEMLLDSARFGIVEGLEAGITTYADTCSSGIVMRAMSELGVRGIMYQEVFGPDPSQADVAMRELEDRIAKLQTEQTDLVTLGVSPHAPYTVSDRLYQAAAKFANSRRLPLAMHIAESEAEYDIVAKGAGDFAERWQRRGIDFPEITEDRVQRVPQAVHVQPVEADAPAFRPPGTQPAPASGLPVPVAAELISALAAVALAGTVTGPPP